MCAPLSLQIYGGIRGMKGLVYETSVLDADEVSWSMTGKRIECKVSGRGIDWEFFCLFTIACWYLRWLNFA